MPSGLTQSLEDKNFDVQKWLLEDIPRQYGICAMLRDDPMNLPNEEIRKRIMKGSEDLSYYEDKVKEAESNIVAFKKRTRAQWINSYEADRTKSLNYFKETLKKKKAQKSKYDGALKQIKEIRQRFVSHSTPEVIKNIVNGAVESLEKSIDWDFGGMKTEFKYETLDEYKRTQLEGAVHDATYYRQHIIDSKKRDMERLEAFDAYVAFIKTVTTI